MAEEWNPFAQYCRKSGASNAGGAAAVVRGTAGSGSGAQALAVLGDDRRRLVEGMKDSRSAGPRAACTVSTPTCW